MKRLSVKLQKLFSLISGFSLVANSILPGATLPLLFTSPAYAQEVTPSDSPTPTETIAPAPTDTVSPTQEVTPEASPEPTVTPTITEEATPSPTSDELNPTPTEVAQPTETGPPPTGDQEGQILDGASAETPAPAVTATPTPTITPEEPTEQGTLAAQILENVDADTLNLDSFDPSTSASITTDKADYAPTDTAIITGSGFKPNHTYDLTVKSDDYPATSTIVEIETDAEGTFVYAYQLDGEYRPNYQVLVKDGNRTVATTTFTDTSTTSIAATAVANYDQWTANTGTKVDAVASNDTDTTYITNSTSGQSQSFTFSSAGVPAGATITSVTLNAVAKEGEGGSKLKLLVEKGTNVTDRSVGGDNNLTGAYVAYSRVMTTNPFTAAAWTLAEVNTWTVKFGVENGANKIARVSQVYLIVDYTEAATPTPTPTATPTPTPTPTPGGSGPLSAQDIACMGDQPTAPDPLNCTANDIQLASVDNINIIEKSDDGITWTSASGQECDYPGQYIKFTASWHVLATAQDRYNVGLWFANEGQESALHGNCSASTLPSSPSPFFEETDDLCGDINHDSVGTVSPAITVVAQCIAAPGTDQLNLPYCTSWDNNESAGNSCNGPEDTVAGTPSKCNCDNSNPIPITVPPSIEVIKTLDPTNDPGLFDLLVNAVTKKTDATNGDTTGKVGISAGSNTFGEADGTGTSLSDYSSTASCVLRGTQTPVAATKSGNTWTIANVTNGQDIVCTITNTRQTGGLTVIKHVVGGSDLASAWTMHIKQSNVDSVTPFAGAESPGVTNTLNGGSYNVSETGGPSDYTLSYSGDCDSQGNVTVVAGQTKSCTLTNTRDTGSVKVNKLVDTDGNGSYETSNTGANTLGFTWSLDASGTNPMGSTVNSVTTGSHNVNESSVTDYHFVGWYPTGSTQYTCSNPQGTTLPVSVSVTKDQTSEITLCNARDTGTLQVLKNVDLNGDGDFTDASESGATDWKWQYNAGSDHNTGDNAITVPTGNYALTETSKPNFHFVNLQCTGGTLTSNSVAVTTGATVVCTFTNARDMGTIQVTKDVVPNDNGATGWDFAITGLSNNTANDLQDGESSSVFNSMTGSYTVTETAFTGTNAANYNTTYSCSDNTGVLVSGSGTTTSSFTLATGKDVVCTFTNTIKNGTIKVQKNIIGNATDFGFTGNVSGTISTSGGQLTTVDVLPGTYTSTESAKTDWDLNSIICDDSTNGGTASTGDVNTRTATFNVDPGETVTCTFTNTQRGHIIVDKVTNPTDSPQSFDFVATGSGYANFSLTDSATPNDQSLVPGDYGVSETLPSGWEQSDLTCLNQNQEPEIAANIHLGAGETVTCVYTNTQYGSISGVKYEDADGDSTTTGDQTVLSGWVIQLWKWVTDTFVNTGLSDTTDGNGVFSFENLLPGVYQLREVLQAGWTKLFPTGGGIDVTLDAGETDDKNNFVNFQNVSVTACKVADPDGLIGTTDGRTNVAGWQVDLLKNSNTIDDTRVTGENGCYTWTDLGPGDYSVSEATQSGWTNLNPTTHNFGTVQSGETYSHTFVNTQYGSIAVVKQTIPDGSQQSFEFDSNYHTDNFLLTDGFFDLSGYLVPGTYSVSELTPTGWDLTSATCNDGSDPSSISLQAGEDILCTFTNTQRGHIIVDKVTDPSGSTQSFDFVATGSGYTNFSLTDSATPNDQTLAPGTYGISESVPAGWNLTDTSCVSSIRDTESAANLELDAGETITCTFTNTELGNITVVKYNDHNGNGIKDVGDEVLGDTGTGAEIEATRWEIHLVGTNVNAYQWTGAQVAGQVTFSGLLPNSFTLSEQLKAGWDQTNIACGSETGIDDDNSHPVTLSAGQDLTCYIGNQGRGTITVNKNLDTDGVDGADVFGYTEMNWLLGSADYTMGSTASVAAGTYDIAEGSLESYHFTSLICKDQNVGSADTSVSVAPGEDVICTYTNTRDTGSIIVHKIIDADGDPLTTDDQTDGENWTIDVDGQEGDTSDPTAQLTNGDGDTTFSSLKTGNYNVSELLQDGYAFVDAYCDDQELDTGETTILDVAVGSDEAIHCTFINTPNGTIHGQKWNDLNGDGERSRDEPVLAGWKIFLDENDNQTWEDGEQFMLTDGNQELGWYWFEHLFPGTYSVCEELQDGWVQTSSPQCHTVDIPNGESSCPGPDQLNSIDGATCDFGNQQLDPILTITKENNTGGADKHPGDSVIFTLTVTATQSAAFNVTVTDLPPKGFTYQSGSWTSNSSVRGDLKAGGTTTEPTYASPGVWQLGDMVVDEVVTLTYTANISSDQQSGLYHDLAWAAGCRFETNCTVGDGNSVLSNAINPGFVDDHFVGTQVNIIRDGSAGVNLEVKGEVLGASTELPATGANTFWLYVAVALVTGGLTFGALGWYIRRKHE